jgi:hypothetical protein
VIVAHVAGLPLEEIAPSFAGAGVGLLLARAWLMVRFGPRQRREPRR